MTRPSRQLINCEKSGHFQLLSIFAKFLSFSSPSHSSQPSLLSRILFSSAFVTRFRCLCSVLVSGILLWGKSRGASRFSLPVLLMFTIRNARNALNRLRRGSEFQGYTTVAGSTTIESEPTPHSQKQGKVHAGVWVIVGFVLSSLLSAGVVHQSGLGNSRREGFSTAETCDRIAKFEEAGGVRLGPSKSSLAGVGKGGVPGPNEVRFRLFLRSEF